MSNCFFDHFVDAPSFGLTQGPRLDNANLISHLATIAFIVSGKLILFSNILVIKWMFHKALHANHNRFIHFIADN